MKRFSCVGGFCLLFGMAAIFNPVFAQTETYNAAAVSEQGGQYTLVIQRTGTRLKFDLTAKSAQSSLGGLPHCDSVDLKPDGNFLTYCGGFQPQEPGRTRLEGNLNQNSARIDEVFRFGRAEFKLVRTGPG